MSNLDTSSSHITSRTMLHQSISLTFMQPGDKVTCMYCLQVLRNTLNCNLPIEIYHNGQRDVGPVTRAAFTVGFPTMQAVNCWLCSQTMPLRCQPSLRIPKMCSVSNAQLLQAFQDVRFIDLTTLGLPANHRKPKLYNGYVQKILSLYSTRFQEVNYFVISSSWPGQKGNSALLSCRSHLPM